TAVVEAFVKEMGVTYRVALDPTWATARTYAVRAVPATFLIDRAGNVVLRELGERDWMEEAKQRAVEGLLQASGADTRQSVATLAATEPQRVPTIWVPCRRRHGH